MEAPDFLVVNKLNNGQKDVSALCFLTQASEQHRKKNHSRFFFFSFRVNYPLQKLQRTIFFNA